MPTLTLENIPGDLYAQLEASAERKPWRYALISHDVITENMSLASLAGSSREVPPKV